MNGKLKIHSPARNGQMGTTTVMTVDQMTELHDSIESSMRDRELFLSREWNGPSGKLD
jgi:hypothetical protein